MLMDIVNNFCDKIQKIINLLKRHNVFPKKYEEACSEFFNYIKQDENAVFKLFDVSTHYYVYGNLIDNDIPPSIIQLLLQNQKQKLSSSKQKVLKEVEGVIRNTILKILREHHKLIMYRPKNKQIKCPIIVLLLIEYTYRHFLSSEEKIEKNTICKLKANHAEYRKLFSKLDSNLQLEFLAYLNLLKKEKINLI